MTQCDQALLDGSTAGRWTSEEQSTVTDMSDAIEILKKVRGMRSGPDFFEVYQVHSFRCIRHKNGGFQTVDVKIYDAGPDADPLIRYSCVATADDGCTAAGNPAQSIETALAIVHWYDLDNAESVHGRS